MRVGIFAPGHPDLRAGGSEVAAHSLFRALAEKVDGACFFATAYDQDDVLKGAPAAFSRDGREYLLPNLVDDYFYISGSLNVAVLDRLVEQARQRRLDILHFHHFLGIGLDGIFYLRARLPTTRFVFTAHEYLSICAREGQLVRSEPLKEKRCDGPTPAKCAMCMPLYTPAEFVARDAVFQRFFDVCDAVVAPSRFLAQKIASVCPSEKIHVVPNALSGADRFDADPVPATRDCRRFGYFGQITPYKGLDVFLDAAKIFDAQHGGAAKFSVFGKIVNKDSEKSIRADIDATPNAEFRGAYDSGAALQLMGEVDWIVVPSIWWENAPVVIEEALCAGRPVLCSDIGGMAEKIEDGVSGLHFTAASSRSLAKVIQLCCGNPELWRKIAKTRRRPPTAGEVADRHIELYRRVLQAGAPRPFS